MLRTSQASSFKPFSLLVKPASADCNLHCTYCFYLDKCALYPETKRHRMEDAVLERMIASYMVTDQPVYSFGWQGGEPTLMGFEFFQRVIDLQKKYGRRGAVVSNGLQTNATLVDDDLAALLSKYKFLVGVSIDGPPDVHDRYRKTAGGRGSHEEVLRGIDWLRRHQVAFNALVLVNSANVTRAAEIYYYLIELGIHHHQYIPCVEFGSDGDLLSFAITGRQWGDFLCEIFDTWIQKDVRRVSIRHFDAILNHMVQWRYTMCTQSGTCGQYFLVEYNGDVYPCDFFVEPAKKLGNVMENSWDELMQSPKYRAFARQKSGWNSRCAACAYLRYCSGDCLKHRFNKDTHPQAPSWLCAGWMRFYRHSLDGFEKIALFFLNERQATLPPNQRRQITKLPKPRIGRNDPCYCGSGKKLKQCHTSIPGKRR